MLAASLFVVPIRNQCTLCTIDKGQLVEINPIPAPVPANLAMNENGWIAWFEEDRENSICRAHADAQPEEQRFPPIPLPKHLDACSIVFLGQSLIVATLQDKIGLLDFAQIMPEWQPLDLPIPQIDRLLAAGNDLVTICRKARGGVLRRWKAGLQAPPGEASYPSGGSEERSAIGPRWIAVLESAFHMVEESLHLYLFDADTLQLCAHLITVTVYGLFVYPHAGQPVPDAPIWSDVAWLGDVLLVAAGKRGIGVLDLRGVPKPEPIPAGQRSADAPFSGECSKRLCYLALPSSEGEVVRVIPAPGTGFLAIVKSQAGHATILIESPELV